MNQWVSVRKPHLRELLSASVARQQFKESHGHEWTEGDLEEIHAELKETFAEIVLREEFIRPVDGTTQVLEILDRQGISVSTTTGYGTTVVTPLLDTLERKHRISFDEVLHGYS